MFTPRQLRLITSAQTRLGTNGNTCSLEYYAVRDPSIVRVVPLSLPPLPNGFRHIKLMFQFDKPNLLPDAVTMGQADGREIWAFVMTIGLPIAREERFYSQIIGDYPGQNFSDLYTRAREVGCEDVD